MAQPGSLVIRLHSLGDVVLAQPAVAHLARTRGPVVFLTRREYLPAASRFGSRVIPLGLEKGHGLGGLREAVRAADAPFILDLQGSAATYAALFLRRAARFRTDRGLRRRVLRGSGDSMPYRADQFLQLAGGRPPAKPILERRSEAPGKRIAGIVCGSRWPMKEIPPGVCAELARLFTDLAGMEVILLGGPADSGTIGRIASNAARPGKVRTYCGEEGVEGLIGRIESLTVLVAPDSGPAHIASALGTRLVVVFTSTSPSLGFWRSSVNASVGPLAPCSPCHRHGGSRCRKGTRQCSEALVPRVLFEAAVREASS